MSTIVLVEDEVNIASFVQRGLTESGYNVYVAHDGKSGIDLIRRVRPDLMVLDIVMPEMTGLQICKVYRHEFGFHEPIILLTALGTTGDIVLGLEAGADDYLVKPFTFAELQARIKALLRRVDECGGVPDLYCGDLKLNIIDHRAERGGVVIELTQREYRLLECLMRNKNQVLSRLDLLKAAWDKNFDTNTNVVDVYITYLRAKIDREFPVKLIKTVAGKGYIMVSK